MIFIFTNHQSKREQLIKNNQLENNQLENKQLITNNQKTIIMKKSIVYLGVALVAFANVSFASNFNSVSKNKNILEFYDSSSPLTIAISKGDIEVVKKFIEYGTDVNEISNGMTPLMVAARYNKVEIIKILIEKGARLNEKDEKGFTALKYAELSNATDAIAYFKQS
jgi:ankyrin repeat protein